MPHQQGMVNMKIDPKTRQEKSAEPVPIDRQIYPYDLLLTLDTEALEKLNLGSLPKVGKTLELYAKVDVTAVSEHESESGSNRSVSLQITDLGLYPEGSGDDDAVDKLYGKA